MSNSDTYTSLYGSNIGITNSLAAAMTLIQIVWLLSQRNSHRGVVGQIVDVESLRSVLLPRGWELEISQDLWRGWEQRLLPRGWKLRKNVTVIAVAQGVEEISISRSSS
uniref:Uncharacterized protein n=1 Tax=Oryza barthii TaxID=65489 RepID=A0A0D3F368_9ORYZ